MDRSFAQKLAARRSSPETAYSVIVFGLVVVGVAVLQLFREGSTALSRASRWTCCAIGIK